MKSLYFAIVVLVFASVVGMTGRADAQVFDKSYSKALILAGNGTDRTNTISILAPTLSPLSPYTITLPIGPPLTAGLFLTSTTGGAMSWASASASNWLLTGNGSIAAGSYLGTTDANDLVFKTVGTTAMTIGGASNAQNVGIGIAPTTNLLSVNGNIQMTNSTNDKITTNNTDLVMEQTGDTYGTTRLHIQNRNGSNCALFEQAGSVNLADFGFKPGTGVQSNVRLEDRAGTIRNTANNAFGEFEFFMNTLSASSGAATYNFSTGEGATSIELGNFGLGMVNPTQLLQMQNGNLLLSNTSATADQLQFQGTSTGISSFQAGAQGANTFNYILPTSAPSANQVLAVSTYTAPNAQLIWANASAGNVTSGTLTTDGALYASGASAISSTAAMTNGQLLIGSTGAAPVLSALTQGAGILITNGAGAITIANAGVLSLANGGGITASASTGAITLGSTATSANTASAIVARDASGNFSAGTITAALNGNATTATTATNFSGSLSGDVTGTQSTTKINNTAAAGNDIVAALNFATPTSPIDVAAGGSGLPTLTAHSIQVGNGTTAVTQLAVGGAGQILTGVASANPAWTSTPTLGVVSPSGTTGSLAFANSASTFLTTIEAGIATAAVTYELPTAAGAAGDLLTTTGSSSPYQLSWAAPGSTYILNQTTAQSSSNFNISGIGVAPTFSGGDAAAGGSLTVRGGNGSSTIGGNLTLSGGTTTAGAGSTVTITSGNGVGTTQAGGNIALTAGHGGATTSAGGAVNLTAGAGGATSGAGGAITLGAGNATASGAGGLLSLQAGDAVGTNQTAGGVLIDAGNSSGTGTGSTITFNAAPIGTTSGTTTSTTKQAVLISSPSSVNSQLLLGASGTGSPTATSSTGVLALANDTSSFVTSIKAPNVLAGGGGYTYILPVTAVAPTTNQVLSVQSITGTTVQLQWGTSASTPPEYYYQTTNITSPGNDTTTSGQWVGLSHAAGYSFSPKETGRMLITITGNIFMNNAGNSGTALAAVQMYYGTGTAPSHAATSPATSSVNSLGPLCTVSIESGDHNEQAPFCVSAFVSGLTVGSNYWIDGWSTWASGCNGSALNNVQFTVVELP